MKDRWQTPLVLRSPLHPHSVGTNPAGMRNQVQTSLAVRRCDMKANKCKVAILGQGGYRFGCFASWADVAAYYAGFREVLQVFVDPGQMGRRSFFLQSLSEACPSRREMAHITGSHGSWHAGILKSVTEPRCASCTPSYGQELGPNSKQEQGIPSLKRCPANGTTMVTVSTNIPKYFQEKPCHRPVLFVEGAVVYIVAFSLLTPC